MLESDYGPHRGIASVAGYITAQQELGIVRADVDAKVVASLVVNDAFQRAAIPKLIGNRKGIQPRATFVETLTAMLQPKS
jgi:hypothetical protein